MKKIPNILEDNTLHFLSPNYLHIILTLHLQRKFAVTYEGPEGVKWELGFAYFLAGKMGFHALGWNSSTKKQ